MNAEVNECLDGGDSRVNGMGCTVACSYPACMRHARQVAGITSPPTEASRIVESLGGFPKASSAIAPAPCDHPQAVRPCVHHFTFLRQDKKNVRSPYNPLWHYCDVFYCTYCAEVRSVHVKTTENSRQTLGEDLIWQK